MSNPEIDALRAAIAARPKAADLAEMRRGIDARGLANKLADDVAVEPVTAAGVKAEWTSTPNAAANRAILYVHGGGFVIGSLDSHRHAVAEMGRAAASRPRTRCRLAKRWCGTSRCLWRRCWRRSGSRG